MARDVEELEDMKVAELRGEAKEAGVSGASHMRKDDLVDALSGSGKESGRKNGKPEPALGDDAVTLLTKDHEKVKGLFKQALEKESGDESVVDLAEQIIAELELHAQVEEEIFYPALKAKAIEADEDEAKDEVLEAYVEHDSVKELIAKIKVSSPSDESYKALLRVMSEQVEHHVEEEENEMFEQAKELLGQEILVELGAQIVARKATLVAA